MRVDTVIMEISLEVPKIKKNRTRIGTSYFIPGPEDFITFHRGIYNPVFIAAVFTIARNWNNLVVHQEMDG